ncbi:MAG: ATP-binding cassette domain-containing protein [Thiohalorhabdus sp.]|uniref:ATP-binding cassette domain-containing protein n=1 Tax=Thiohalorhabdus sp. TaxID=3094134 RepID=UPI00397FD1AA
MSLITLTNVEVNVGGPYPLLEGADLAVEAGERVCIVGRNGAGKSTLLRVLAGEVEPEEGEVRPRPGLRIAKLTQEVPQGTEGTAYDVVAGALGHLGDLLAEFHRLSQNLATAEDAEALGRVQARLDEENGWDVSSRVSEVVTRLGLPEDADFATLSGGMKRRVLLGRALVQGPDLLLLDEPTNHLDIDNILWLQDFLKGFGGALVFVTHDRSFLRALATRIVEIDRGEITSWPGDYDNYLRRREERLNAEAQERARFDKKLAEEEAWIRQGIKARRKRNMGRVRQLQEMRKERAQRREQQGSVRMEASRAEKTGKRVVEAEGVTFGYEGQPIVRDFSTIIGRGDRIGIVGPNGSGKTTLIRLLLGELEPQQGTVETGANLQVAYFDQQRAQLDEGATAADNVTDGGEYVTVNGNRRHVIGYLQDFLFTPDRARAPITRLSGGERNRLLLARLFATDSNVLVMDEPTNDLDIETLELLEDLVANYEGTVLIVSHDRAFLDNVVTSLLVMRGDGRVDEFIGGYSEYLERRPQEETAPAKAKKDSGAKAPKPQPARESPEDRKRLSNWERKELAELPERIEDLEGRISALTERLADPAIYQDPAVDLKALNDELAAAQEELEAAYRRWEELEAG